MLKHFFSSEKIVEILIFCYFCAQPYVKDSSVLLTPFQSAPLIFIKITNRHKHWMKHTCHRSQTLQDQMPLETVCCNLDIGGFSWPPECSTCHRSCVCMAAVLVDLPAWCCSDYRHQHPCKHNMLLLKITQVDVSKLYQSFHFWLLCTKTLQNNLVSL